MDAAPKLFTDISFVTEIQSALLMVCVSERGDEFFLVSCSFGNNSKNRLGTYWRVSKVDLYSSWLFINKVLSLSLGFALEELMS